MGSAGSEKVEQLHIKAGGVAQGGSKRDGLAGLSLGQRLAERTCGCRVGGQEPASGGGYDGCQIGGHGDRSLWSVLALPG